MPIPSRKSRRTSRIATGDFGLDQQRFPGDGVVTGFGLMDGRRIAVFAQDFTVLGGSFSEIQALKVGRLIEMAIASGLPVVALLDSVGRADPGRRLEPGGLRRSVSGATRRRAASSRRSA